MRLAIKSYFVFLVLLSTQAFAQHEPREFGDVPLQDLRLNVCEFDSSATAVILFDKVKAELTDRYSYERHLRIKILKKQALTSWGDFSIVYNKSVLTLSKVRAATYNLANGKVTVSEVQGENKFSTKVNKRTSMVSVAFPNVVEGSVVEYSYRLTTTSSLSLLKVFGSIMGMNIINLDWEFQHSIPAYWCEYTYTGDYGIWYQQGTVPIDNPKTELSRGFEINRWVINNVPAFYEEPNSLPKSNLIGKVIIDLFNKSWNQIAVGFTHLQKYGETARDTFLLGQLSQKFRVLTTPKQKIDSVVEYVKRNVRWNEEIDRSPNNEFANVLAAREGSSSEINLVAMALLKRCGLKSFPVAVSTREHGIVLPNRAVGSQLNDIIVAVIIPKGEKSTETILVDVTDRYLGNEYINSRYHSGYGLLINEKQSELIELNIKRSKKSVSADIQIDSLTKEVRGNMEFSFHGNFASEMRKRYSSEGEEKLNQTLNTICPTKLGRSSFLNLANRNLPFQAKFPIKDDNLLPTSENQIYLYPLKLVHLDDEVFKSDSRVSPLSFSPPTETLLFIKIEVPRNYAVDELPQSTSLTFAGNAARFILNVSQQNKNIYITSQIVYNRTTYLPEEYKALKEFHNLVVSKQASAVVLSKKN